jgi:prepilin-type N-terminal cleavage/methylation domain-containing protein/prepilin-type processing-associated H-X9-DG protein
MRIAAADSPGGQAMRRKRTQPLKPSMTTSQPTCPSFTSPAPAASRIGRTAFTLVEVLVVVSVIGVLAGMLLPAVQHVRESARRTTCANNVRQAAAGIAAYESARRTLPPGSDQLPRQPDLPAGTQFAWSALILPYIEQAALANRFDYAKSWNATGGNDAAADTSVGAYVCPTGRVQSVGKADYGGVSGSVIVSEGKSVGVVGVANGLLVPVDTTRQDPVQATEVTDGLAQTLMVAESVDRCDPAVAAEIGFTYGRWAWVNHFAQSAAYITMPGSDIRSHHTGGATVAFGDGHVALLGNATAPAVLAALCTRSGGETPLSAAPRK